MSCIFTSKEKSDKLSNESSNQDFTRSAIIAELDAISLYQSQIENSTDQEFKRVVEHIMNDEKEHVAELNCMLMRQDPNQEKIMKKILKSANITELDCLNK